jgi:hypothetical protein
MVYCIAEFYYCEVMSYKEFLQLCIDLYAFVGIHVSYNEISEYVSMKKCREYELQ